MVEEGEFLGFAAGVLGVSPQRLSLETTYGSIPEWDSLAHLRLVTEVASRYGVEIPFAEVVNVTSLWEFRRRVNGGSVKKVVAVDLDGTLWSGTVGEEGVDALVPNETLQRELKALKARGVLLVILSKNDERVALAGLDRQPVLGRDDFVSWRIGWESKAEGLASLAHELNLGAESFVFVDDSPAERLEMSVRLPDVTVASFPPCLTAYFPSRPLTDEDRRKTEEYRSEAKRQACLKVLERPTAAEIWRTLGIGLNVWELADGDVPRVAQLSQKANQFNVRTQRRTEAEVRRLAAEGLVVTARARDRFGDLGLIAYVAVSGNEIVDWVMSCRAMGRGLEERIEAEVERLLAARGICEVTALWRSSGRNAPVRMLFDRLGFALLSETETERRYRKALTHAI